MLWPNLSQVHAIKPKNLRAHQCHRGPKPGSEASKTQRHHKTGIRGQGQPVKIHTAGEDQLPESVKGTLHPFAISFVLLEIQSYIIMNVFFSSLFSLRWEKCYFKCFTPAK